MPPVRDAEVRAASVRALSGDPSVQLRGRRVFRGEAVVPMPAPHLRWDATGSEAAVRGAADGVALRLRHSDAATHRRLLPDGGAARWVFELLEQFRVESLTDPRLPGVRANLRSMHEHWSLAYHAAGLTASRAGLVLYTVAQICRSRIMREPVVEATEDLLEEPRAELAPHLGHAIAGLHNSRADQERYAVHALAIAAHAEALVGGALAGEDGGDEDSVLTLYVDPDEDPADGGASVGGRRGPLEAGASGYQVFTTAYDRVRDARDVVRQERLDTLRAQLDKAIEASGPNVRRLARDVHRLLRVPVEDSWSGGHEEGYVDGRRLSRLVTSPAQRDLFRLPGTASEPDCHIGVLVDCSGSMKASAERVAVFVDVLAHAFDLANVGNEVLGFTTGAWNGGRALRDWERAGRPESPGRLNELAQLVFRDPEVPWRTARSGIAALLRPDLFREGVDGEAVRWAAGRIGVREVSRRILVVVSDGSPMDSATARVNGPTYLDEHLRDVVAEQQARGVEIVGVAVGAADLGSWYDRWMRLDTDPIGMRTYRELLALIGPRRR